MDWSTFKSQTVHSDLGCQPELTPKIYKVLYLFSSSFLFVALFSVNLAMCWSRVARLSADDLLPPNGRGAGLSARKNYDWQT